MVQKSTLVVRIVCPAWVKSVAMVTRTSVTRQHTTVLASHAGERTGAAGAHSVADSGEEDI